jgi:hypothetical protein
MARLLHHARFGLLKAAYALAFALFLTATAQAQYAQPSQRTGTYSADEMVGEGHRFFGTASREIATLIERATARWGQPNGYILGQEGGGALIGGLRYGEGTLFMRHTQGNKVFWQGPSIGWDFGGDGARTMILVYNLPSENAIFQRFGGINGSAYLIGGFGMTALTINNVVLVPIRTGVGLRLGVNVGYLKFTNQATWFPF